MYEAKEEITGSNTVKMEEACRFFDLSSIVSGLSDQVEWEICV